MDIFTAVHVTGFYLMATLAIIVLVYETLCAIWYHFYNLKNVINIHGGILLLIQEY